MKAFCPEGRSCSFFSSNPCSCRAGPLLSSKPPLLQLQPCPAGPLLNPKRQCLPRRPTASANGRRYTQASEAPAPQGNRHPTAPQRHPHATTLRTPHSCPKASNFGLTHHLDVRRSPTPRWEPGPLGKRSWACKAADKRLQPCLQGAQATAWTAKCPGTPEHRP